MKKRLNFLCVLLLVLMLTYLVIITIFGIYGINHTVDVARASIEAGVRPSTPPNFKQFLIALPIYLVVTYLTIMILVAFVKFILNVNRDKVFLNDNVKLLRKMGWFGLTSMSLVIIANLIMKISFVDFFNDCSVGIFDSIFYLIIAEVFAIGIKLREEQELTI